ncbi:unnamed protein product [Gulo gulo]|uniref:Uncharacterized protein n=1 Tax=Gulo gulo TaxID=48420 RepID=A0A9X9PV12_GULGU|nr:unnamed protein product [Gulo gulo]
MGMQRPLAQENWLGGQVRARDRRAGASSLLSRQSLSPSHFHRSWMQRLLAQANSPGWHWGGGT